MIKKGLLAMLVFVLLALTGCSNEQESVMDPLVTNSNIQSIEGNVKNEAEDIEEIFCDIYYDTVNTNKPGDLEAIRSIVERLGENGYVAVDRENQIDMTEIGKVIQFCERVDDGTEGELTVIVVSYLGGFTKYDFTTENGKIDIVREYYQFVDGQLKNMSTGMYRADSWEYTEEGYLLFEGHWVSEEYYILSLSEMPEHVALRVQPLDEECRKLNRKYIRSIGYKRNNMFIIDWSEEEFGNLDFYDVYDIFYPKVNGRAIPYVADDNLEVGAVYRIPEEEFETVIMAYFNIDSETLQSKTRYSPEDASYVYRPRGFYEVEYPDMPYPEVTGYTENADGTMTLTVNVVFPAQNTSKVYAHEVVIRPLGDGRVQYVSNHIIPSEDNYEQTWNVSRLTEDEWEELYGELEFE